jgi:alpha-tubulin suppressor-like RCC1 family protein
VNDSTGTGFLTDIKAIADGRWFNCALKTDGSVWCWGRGIEGQLGEGSLFITSDLPVQVKDSTGTGFLTGVNSITAGAFHTCAAKDDGTMWCWGKGTDGQLGNNDSSTNVGLPVQVKDIAGTGILTGVQSISTGDAHSCAITNGGIEVLCWGENSVGQLGNNSTVDSLLPIVVSGLTEVKSITSGSNHSCAKILDGTAWCWGSNSLKEISPNADTQYITPVMLSFD